jgi:glycosyltransferase involved in cell wall biosynthesis
MTIDVALFFPAYQEEANLPIVVSEAVSKLHQLYGNNYRVIIVDDGSADPNSKKGSDDGATARVAAALAEAHLGQVLVVTHETNQGYGAAFRTGCQAALATDAKYVVFCDADGQFKPSEVEKLLTHAKLHGDDLVIGYRVERADNLLRRITGRGWHFVSRVVLRFGNVTDVDCGFKLFTSEALAVLHPELMGDHAVISPEILALAKGIGYRTGEVAVSHFPREHGHQSGLDSHVVLSSLWQMLEVRRHNKHTIRKHKTINNNKEMTS